MKNPELASFFSTANSHCTESQREAFNEFRAELHVRTDNLRDVIRRYRMGREVAPEALARINVIVDSVCELPFLLVD